VIQVQRILVPTDFTVSAESALTYGKEFARAFGASLHVLHIVEDPFLYHPSSEISVPPLDYRRQMEKEAREQLEKRLTAAERAELHAELVVGVGYPFLEIIRYAKSQSMDLIIMGTHGRGPVAHMLMGSVAERVVRKAPCPVLTVRHPEHEFVMP
jgi:nucleotide-binding universal stress UspA family protein